VGWLPEEPRRRKETAQRYEVKLAEALAGGPIDAVATVAHGPQGPR